jgi:hypothetical protein
MSLFYISSQSVVLEPSAPTTVVSPYRFQLHLFSSRLDGAARFIERHYPQHSWRLELITKLHRELLDNFPSPSDLPPSLAADLSPEFVFRYSSVISHTESDTLPCEWHGGYPMWGSLFADCPGLSESDIFEQRKYLFALRSHLTSLVNFIPMYPANALIVCYSFLDHILINFARHVPDIQMLEIRARHIP